jgi:hypothetical protein
MIGILISLLPCIWIAAFVRKQVIRDNSCNAGVSPRLRRAHAVVLFLAMSYLIPAFYKLFDLVRYILQQGLIGHEITAHELVYAVSMISGLALAWICLWLARGKERELVWFCWLWVLHGACSLYIVVEVNLGPRMPGTVLTIMLGGDVLILAIPLLFYLNPVIRSHLFAGHDVSGAIKQTPKV